MSVVYNCEFNRNEHLVCTKTPPYRQSREVVHAYESKKDCINTLSTAKSDHEMIELLCDGITYTAPKPKSKADEEWEQERERLEIEALSGEYLEKTKPQREAARKRRERANRLREVEEAEFREQAKRLREAEIEMRERFSKLRAEEINRKKQEVSRDCFQKHSNNPVDRKIDKCIRRRSEKLNF